MKRYKHSLSYYKLTSINQGNLVPIGLTEVLPGDTFRHSTSAFIRVSPLVFPVMHPVHVYIHHWFVPHRLVWDNWEPFITGGPDGMDASSMPTINPTTGQTGVGTLLNYLGVPVDVAAMTVDPTINALALRGYNLIWNENYRDQDLQTPLVIETVDGNDTLTNRTLQNVCWGKDYFTSSRPWTQKGPEVTIPLSGDAPIKGIGISPTSTASVASGATFKETDDLVGRVYANIFNTNNALVGIEADALGAGGSPNIYADLSNVNATNINDLRLALALQRYEEARARYGSRYTEYLAYLGVRSSDARLSRPEYLGGGRQTIQFSEVLQTAPTTSGNVAGVGNLKGHGIAALRSNRYQRFFEEHGYVFTLMFVRPKTIYAQGIPRHFNRRVKEDYWQKELQHIGQQEVLNKEVYAAHTTPNGVFGYQDRYDEYRRSESLVSGEFLTTLDDWHMARIFSADPALNASFVSANPTDRIYVSTATNQLQVMANHSIQARRMVAREGTSFTF